MAATFSGVISVPTNPRMSYFLKIASTVLTVPIIQWGHG
jgi:hypothetical protein